VQWIPRLLVLLLLATPTAAQQRLGSEFQVNTTTTGGDLFPEVAADGEGNFVVVWRHSEPFPSPEDFVLGRRFDRAGSFLGSELQIVGGRVSSPDVASDAQGRFVVVWQDREREIIAGQRFDPSGNAIGDEFQVNTSTFGSFRPQNPAVAADAQGNFVVVWNYYSYYDRIAGRRYDAAGNSIGEDFVVNTSTTYWGLEPAVAMDGAGRFVVVWQYGFRGCYGDAFEVLGQRYDAAGSRIGGEFLVSTSTVNYYEGQPAVVADSEGDFVVVWGSGSADLGYGQFFLDVLGQRYDAAGSPIGGEFVVSAQSSYDGRPAVTAGTGGEFIVVWQSGQFNLPQPVELDVFAQRYDPAGKPIGDAFRVNTYTSQRQERATVAFNSGGDFVVIWQDSEILGQRFAGEGLQLAVEGVCPGPAQVTLVNAPPNSEVAVVSAANANGFTKGGVLCAGTELEIGEPFALPPVWVIVDDEGNGSATLSLAANRCWVEALALADCASSSAVEVSGPGELAASARRGRVQNLVPGERRWRSLPPWQRGERRPECAPGRDPAEGW
jgi:hypothetical protein